MIAETMHSKVFSDSEVLVRTVETSDLSNQLLHELQVFVLSSLLVARFRHFTNDLN